MPSKRVIFFGTPEIGASVLHALLESGVEIVGVVTRQDKPMGRKHEISISAVKRLATESNIEIFQPASPKEIIKNIEELKPDLIVTCAYGCILPSSLLSIPTFGCINVHTSLLPRWRGGAPIHRAIMAGDEKTGVTIMYMEKGLDTGNIILQQEVVIEENETYDTLYKKLSEASYKLVKENISSLFSKDVKSQKQDSALVTQAKVITPEEESIDWKEGTARGVHNKIRGLNSIPLAHTTLNGKVVKLFESVLTGIGSKEKPGTIISVSKKGIEVSTTDLNLLLTKIQIAGKKPVSVEQMVNGNHAFKVGDMFL